MGAEDQEFAYDEELHAACKRLRTENARYRTALDDIHQGRNNSTVVAFILQGVGLVVALGGYCWLLAMTQGTVATPIIVIIAGVLLSIIAAIKVATSIAATKDSRPSERVGHGKPPVGGARA